MDSITVYSDLIGSIPAKKQSTVVKKTVWSRFSYNNEIEKTLFGSTDKVELSREDVLTENDIVRKLIMVLMWGYPNGGRGNNIEHIISKIDDLKNLVLSVNGQNLTKDQAKQKIAEFSKIPGLGASTWSKILYFFNVSIDSRRCQIYDLKIVDSLNNKQFAELNLQQKWKQSIKHYYQYIELMDTLATNMSVSPEQLEIFMFYFNLSYKFTEKSKC